MSKKEIHIISTTNIWKESLLSIYSQQNQYAFVPFEGSQPLSINLFLVFVDEETLRAAERAKKQFPSVPFLYLTEAFSCEIEKLCADSLHHYLKSPFTEKELIYAIDKQLRYAHEKKEEKNKDKKFQTVIDHIPFDLWVMDEKSTYTNVNAVLANRFGTTPEKMIGKSSDIIFTKEQKKQYELEDKYVREKRKHVFFETSAIFDGEERIFEVHKNPVIDVVGEVVGIIGISKDITEIKRSEQKIRSYAYTDALTKLANRRGLYSFLKHHLKEKQVHLFFIDLDDFKQVNDTCGHHFGDEVLAQIATRLANVCNDGFVSRIGGDEFVAVFQGAYDSVHLANIAKEMIQTIRNLVHDHHYAYNVSASVGIVSCMCNEYDLNNLLIKGDMALYQAKENGKNQYVFYTEGLEEERLVRINMERDLHHALEKEEFTLHYQPIYTNEEQIRGFEALLRWNNETYKNTPTVTIIDVVEKSAMMNRIGKYIMKQAFLFAKEVNEDAKEKKIVSVNISTIQIMKENFIEEVKNLIEETKICPSWIGIEITETVLLENIEGNIQKLNQLKELGIAIMLDDFGTGYSSFNYLVQLPITYIKIDKSFVWGMDTSKQYSRLIQLIVEAGHSMNMSVIAEGVETVEQRNLLEEIGIDYLQGYYYHKPLLKEQAKELLLYN